jgi:hypothetical protein
VVVEVIVVVVVVVVVAIVFVVVVVVVSTVRNDFNTAFPKLWSLVSALVVLLD